jgi:hypothetical protein
MENAMSRHRYVAIVDDSKGVWGARLPDFQVSWRRVRTHEQSMISPGL